MTTLAIIGIAAAIILLFLLAFCRVASAADDRDNQLIAEIQAMRGDAPCPWPLAETPIHMSGDRH